MAVSPHIPALAHRAYAPQTRPQPVRAPAREFDPGAGAAPLPSAPAASAPALKIELSVEALTALQDRNEGPARPIRTSAGERVSVTVGEAVEHDSEPAPSGAGRREAPFAGTPAPGPASGPPGGRIDIQV